MARKPIKKELKGTRLLKEYASWVYCEGCNKTIAYLCYVTYNHFDFKYKCRCGNEGAVSIAFDGKDGYEFSDEKMITIKNRLCCPSDESPLITILDKNLESYRAEISCAACKNVFVEEREKEDTPLQNSIK